MRQTVLLRASRLQSSLRQTSSLNRSYATKPGGHPTDSIPTKGALPVSNRFLRNTLIFGGGILIGSYYGYRSSSSSPTTEITVEPAWSTYTLESKDTVSPTAAIFTLKAKKLIPSTYENFWQSSVWAVDIQQPQLQIVREYTPLPPALDSDGCAVSEGDTAKLHLLIREEFKGEVSGYLHRLPVGANIQVSKAYSQVNLDQESPDNLVMVVGGTGITTALQAIHALLERKQSSGSSNVKKPFIHVLWANRRREDCLGGISDTPTASANASSWWASIAPWLGLSSPTPVTTSATQQVEATQLGISPIIDELRRLKAAHAGQIKVDYFVDEEGTFIQAEDVNRALTAGKATPLSDVQGAAGKSFVAISGPDGFMVNLAGEQRKFKNKVSARPTSGVLAEVKEKDWELMVLG